MTGTITKLLPGKGYCFIRGDDRISRFGHARAFLDPVEFDLAREGQGVEFEPVIETGPRARSGGQRATEIRLLPGGYAVERL